MSNPNDLENRPLTEAQLQDILPVSRTTLWRWRHRRVDPIPFLQVGGKILYRWPSVKQWFARQERITMAKNHSA